MVVWVKPSGQEDEEEALGGVLRVEEPNQVSGSVSGVLTAGHAPEFASKGCHWVGLFQNSGCRRCSRACVAAHNAPGCTQHHLQALKLVWESHRVLEGLPCRHTLHKAAHINHTGTCVCVQPMNSCVAVEGAGLA